MHTIRRIRSYAWIRCINMIHDWRRLLAYKYQILHCSNTWMLLFVLAGNLQIRHNGEIFIKSKKESIIQLYSESKVWIIPPIRVTVLVMTLIDCGTATMEMRRC